MRIKQSLNESWYSQETWSLLRKHQKGENHGAMC